MSVPADGSRTTVRVEIAGDKYTLRTDADEEYTRRCAALVDERMRAIGGESGLSAKKTAIMAALSLSDDLLQQQERFRDGALALSGRLREALAETPAESEPG
ncbi:MAG: cell division protein ZapA [Gemmatimonadota bacterium]|nr:cell division protein ZapA [Gemmatimonadota bacterium]MDE2871795.1 cell division protein ZapA [Gemmatimonadota bacterium]